MRIAAIPLILSLTACATAPGAAGGPDLTLLPSQSLPPNGRLMLDCVAFAVKADSPAATPGTVSAVRKGDAGLMRFTCAGPVAEALFDGLAERSGRLGSEWSEDDGATTARATERVNEDLYGVDVCRRSRSQTWCEVHLNVGDFMFDEAP